jgi:hypothetical protein
MVCWPVKHLLYEKARGLNPRSRIPMQRGKQAQAVHLPVDRGDLLEQRPFRQLRQIQYSPTLVTIARKQSSDPDGLFRLRRK